MINSIGLDNKLIRYIVEDAPLKQGLYTPESHIPIVSPNMLEKHTPDYLVIFAWNYADDIIRKLHHLRKRGVNFIIPMPKMRIFLPTSSIYF